MIEVMLVVVIAGILVSIAIPNMAKMRGRAVQAETKTCISSLARAEKAFFVENEAYTDDLGVLGWAPMGSPSYIIGFTSDRSGSGRNDTVEIGSGLGGASSVWSLPLTEGDLPASPVEPLSFTVGAAGNLDNDAVLDQWTLDDAGQFVHVTADM